jgi:hypothetical protein
VHTPSSNTVPDPFDLKKKTDVACLAHLNGLAWGDRFAAVSHGVRLCVRVNDPSLVRNLQNLFPETARTLSVEKSRVTKFDTIFSMTRVASEREDSRGRAITSFFVDDTLIARSWSEDDVLGHFKAWVNLSIATLAPRHVFVHAGVVAWRGQAIIIPGSSCSGKTTLVAELVRQGADYLSDEYAVLDAHGRVYPFPKPISMREPNGLDQVDVPVEDFGGRQCRSPKPAGLILLTKYEPGSDWQPNKLSSGRGVFGLLEHCSAARRSPKRTLRTLGRLASRAQVIRTPRGEARDTAVRILDYLEAQRDQGAHTDSMEFKPNRA